LAPDDIVLDWSTGVYNPRVDITQDTTTLYASDRVVFLLVDDLNPIDAGRLAGGSPDLYFRRFYDWNSEVGAKTLGMASFYLRAVCNLWGVEDFEEITIRHSKYAATRFAQEAAPALASFANSSSMPFNGIRAARERSSPAPTTTAASSCTNAASRRARQRRSSQRCCLKKDASRRACSISSKASQRLRGARLIRTQDSIWRRARRSCSTAQPDTRKARDAERRVSDFVPSVFPDSRFGSYEPWARAPL